MLTPGQPCPIPNPPGGASLGFPTWRLFSGSIFMTEPTVLSGREISTDWLGARGAWTWRGAAGARPKLWGHRSIAGGQGGGTAGDGRRDNLGAPCFPPPRPQDTPAHCAAPAQTRTRLGQKYGAPKSYSFLLHRPTPVFNVPAPFPEAHPLFCPFEGKGNIGSARQETRCGQSPGNSLFSQLLRGFG